MALYSISYGFGLFVVRAADKAAAAALVAGEVEGATVEGVLEDGAIKALEADGLPMILDDYWA